jgi:hypothetical protein
MIRIEKVVDRWLDDTQVALIANYDRLGLRASGKYADSLEPFSTFTESNARIGILAAKHSEYMQQGRLPNDNQDPESIRKWVGWAGSTFLKDWVEDKGLSINPYAVAYKIAREGVKVPNPNNSGGVVSDVVTRQRISELFKEIGLIYQSELRSQIIEEFAL